MLSPFGNQPGQKNVARVIFAARVTLCWVFLWSMTWSNGKAQTDATWTGNGVTQNYSEPDNWLDGVVPVNDVGTTYNVTIPNNQTVLFDLDGSYDVTDLTLGTGSTLTIAPGEQLNVLDDARISGTITTTAGTFTAPGPGAQFLNNSALLYVSGTGQIAIAAAAYTNLLDNYRAHLTFLSAQGPDSLLDLSSVQSFSVAGSWSYYETYYYDVVASDHGVVDLSGVGSIVGAGNGDGRMDEWLRFVIETEGNIPREPCSTSTATVC